MVITGPVELESPITVRSFSESTGVRARDIQRSLMYLGIMATINQSLFIKKRSKRQLVYKMQNCITINLFITNVGTSLLF